MLQSFQEPLVNLCQVFNVFDGVSFFQSLCNSKDAQVGRIGQSIVKVVELGVVVAYEAVHTLSYHTQTLLDHLLEGTSDGHDFTHRLHGRSNVTTNASELGEVPTGYLADHVVKTGSNVC